MPRTLRFASIVALAVVGTGLAAVGGWRFARASAPVAGPIILISVDALRADRLPAYGYTNVRTPAIDALAADAVVFERAYSHATQTLPAHAALLSGRLPFETGVRGDVGFALPPRERLLPQLLRARGFSTGGVASSSLLSPESGMAAGFDFYDADMPGSPDAPAEERQRDGGDSEAIAERWLAAQTSPRAFLFLHLNEPHAPYAPPDRFAALDPYDGEVARVDEIIGRLTHYLKSHQLYDQSTIVLVGDHGEGLGAQGEQEHGILLYDEAIHVPLIVKQAGNAHAGARVGVLVQHADIVPTLLEMARAPLPGNLSGRSLKPLLEGTGTLPARSVYSESMYTRYHFGWSGLTSLTDDGGTVVQPAGDGDARQDPREKGDVLRAYNEALARTRAERWSEASSLWRAIVAREPGMIDAWDQLAAASVQAGEFDTAIEAYRRLAALEPNPAMAQNVASRLWTMFNE